MRGNADLYAWAREVRRSRQIRSGPARVAQALADIWNRTGRNRVFPGYQMLANETGVKSERQVGSNVRALVEAGVLCVRPRNQGRGLGRASNEYFAVPPEQWPEGVLFRDEDGDVPTGSDLPDATRVPTGTELPDGTDPTGSPVHPTGSKRRSNRKTTSGERTREKEQERTKETQRPASADPLRASAGVAPSDSGPTQPTGTTSVPRVAIATNPGDVERAVRLLRDQFSESESVSVRALERAAEEWSVGFPAVVVAADELGIERGAQTWRWHR